MTASANDREYDADAAFLLRISPIQALRELTVLVTDEEIILNGTVGSYYLKQLAQETVMAASGNRVIVNSIKVAFGTDFNTRQSAGEGKGVPPQQATRSENLRRLLVHPTGGIAGLVDDLLGLCMDHGLQLDWHADHCRAHLFGSDWKELLDVPLRKSVFRAILARVATLCNERTPNSVSPFGGQGELSVGANPAAVLSVAFVNTPAIQNLELMPATQPAAAAAQQREITEPYGKPAEPNRPDAHASAGSRECLDHFSDN